MSLLFRRHNQLTAAEIAAFLCLTPAAVRQLIRRHGVKPTGKEGKAYLYDARMFVDTVGGHDRRVVRKRRTLMSQ